MNNCLYSQHLFTELKERYGCVTACICPGGRNSPLVVCDKEVDVISFFDERSAAFFALGRIKRDGVPVVVVTTSGTAVVELFPAVMEAYYLRIPLIIVTADRPKKLRYTGAPQTVNQNQIFGQYAVCLDLDVSEEVPWSEWTPQLPLHLNICFDDPLLALSPNDSSTELSPSSNIANLDKVTFCDRPFTGSEMKQQLSDFLATSDRLLIVVSELPREAVIPVKMFLKQCQAPILLEPLSQLREDSSLRCKMVSENVIDLSLVTHVLRIGGMPVSKVWRLLEKRSDIQVLSVSHLPFSGLSHGDLVNTSYCFGDDKVCSNLALTSISLDSINYDLDPFSESSMVHYLSTMIPKKSMLYLGNSMPIRYWGKSATYEDRDFYITASRGVNGIDGQLSTFLGMASQVCENWAILGDLTTLYDLSAPWVLSQLQSHTIRVVIIHNGGGKIFSHVFPEYPELVNAHSVQFEHWAKMWDLSYIELTDVRLLDMAGLDKHQVIVLKPK